MSYDDQDYGSRRRPRRDSYDAAPIRERRYGNSPPESRHRRPEVRDDDRSRYRDSRDRRSPPRRPVENGWRRGRGSNQRSEVKPCKVLGVFGLSTSTKERDLHRIFSAFGTVVDIKMVYDNMTGRSRGFGFVYFESVEDARNAMSNCEGGLEIDGKMARVDFSLTSGPHNPTPGVYLGRSRRRSGDRSRRRSRTRSRSREYRPSRSHNSSRYSGSRPVSRDRSPPRSWYPPRSRKSPPRSRSPPPYSSSRNGIPDRSLDMRNDRMDVWPERA